MAELTLFAFDPQTNVLQGVSPEDRAVCGGALATPGLTRFQYLTGLSQSLAGAVPEDTIVGSLFQVTAYAPGHPKFVAIWVCSDMNAALPSGAVAGDITGAANGSLYVAREGSDFWKFDYIGEGSIDSSTGDARTLRADLASGEVLTGTGTDLVSYNGFLLVKRPLRERLREGISFLDAGAKGDGATDDWEPMQDVITEIGNLGGGTISVPYGKAFRTTQTLTLASQGVSILGAGANSEPVPISGTASLGVVGEGQHTGASRIIGDFGGDCVIRIANQSCELRGFVVDSTNDRRLSTYGELFAGIRVEAPDVSNVDCRNTVIERVRITNQPGNGIIFVGTGTASRVERFEIDNCRGHGIRVAGGNVSGRVNKSRPGQIELLTSRIARCGGQALVIGGDDADDLDVPYRVEISNMDEFYCCITPAICFRSTVHNMLADVFISGEQIRIVNSAFAGMSQYPTIASTHLPVIARGANITFQTDRFINGHTFAAVLEGHPRPFWGGNSWNIEIINAYITNSDNGAGYFNPAIYAGDDVMYPTATANAYQPVVGTLLRKVVGNRYFESFGGEDRSDRRSINTYADISDSTTASSIRAGYLRSLASTTINDDVAGYVEFESVSTGVSGVIEINALSADGGGARVRFRTGDNFSYCQLMSSAGATFNVGTGVLSTGATDGVNGEFNIRADTTAKRLYLKNRLGGNYTYAVTFTSMVGVTSVGSFKTA